MEIVEDKFGEYLGLKDVREAGSEDLGFWLPGGGVDGGLRIGGPRRNHRTFQGLSDHRSGNRASAGVGSDHCYHAFLGNEALSDCRGLICFGAVVAERDAEGKGLVTNFDTASRINLADKKIGSIF